MSLQTSSGRSNHFSLLPLFSVVRMGFNRLISLEFYRNLRANLSKTIHIHRESLPLMPDNPM